MNSHRYRRTLRQIQPTLEDLDSRIAPAAASAATLAAELRVETRQVSRWEASLATSRPGSREQIFLTNHIARTEGRMAVQDARLARLEPASPTTVVHAQPVGQQPATQPTEPTTYGPPDRPLAPVLSI